MNYMVHFLLFFFFTKLSIAEASFLFFSWKELDSSSIKSWLNIKETTARKKVNHKSWYCVYSFPALHILNQTKIFVGRDNVSSAMKLFGWQKVTEISCSKAVFLSRGAPWAGSYYLLSTDSSPGPIQRSKGGLLPLQGLRI